MVNNFTERKDGKALAERKKACSGIILHLGMRLAGMHSSFVMFGLFVFFVFLKSSSVKVTGTINFKSNLFAAVIENKITLTKT